MKHYFVSYVTQPYAMFKNMRVNLDTGALDSIDMIRGVENQILDLERQSNPVVSVTVLFIYPLEESQIVAPPPGPARGLQ